MLSITGVADCWKPSCQGEGCPLPARAGAEMRRTAAVTAAKAIRSLFASIVVFAPSANPSRACRAQSLAGRPGFEVVARRPASHGFRPGTEILMRACGGAGEFHASQTIN